MLKRYFNRNFGTVVRFLIKTGYIRKEELLFTALDAYGANIRAINRNLAEERKLTEALEFMHHPDTEWLQKNRGTSLILGCGLCDPCKMKANAVTYIRNEENDMIDREFDKQERAWKERQFKEKQNGNKSS